MMGIDFAAPAWIHGVWGVIVLVVLLLWFERRGTGALERFVSRVMQSRLVERPTTRRRVARIACLGLSALALVVALMRPQWGTTFISTPSVGAKIMVCLDVSKSMLAEDVAPNRLERAKADIRDLLPYLQGDQVGLIGFAGRATVFCPLTEDFGFFRLVLDDVSHYSVARGGTQLAEPIRKAVDGFGEASDLARAIILITDGEDHDSFPMEAAKAAAERGIKIVAIGFGDEVQGSEIRYTDPRTGATQTLLYQGKPVISRLDGDTLRELASMTEGVYVPAGTGALDLKSIYDRHLAPLTRGAFDGSRRAVRQEGYQYAVMAALSLLGLAAALTGGRTQARGVANRRTPRSAGRTAALALMVVTCATYGVEAQSGTAPARNGTDPPTATGVPTNSPGLPPGVDDDEPGRTTADQSARDPGGSVPGSAVGPPPTVTPEEARDAYNRALERLSGDDLDAAEELLVAARSAAPTDGELRYSASYNLGFLAAKRGDRLRQTEPEQALEQYTAAADWFRESIRLREGEADPRHNLEVVLRETLALRDQLRERDSKDLAKQLDELAAAQRQLAGTVTAVVDRVASLSDPNEVTTLRGVFRELERDQRAVSSDTGQVVDQARAERDEIEATAESERTPEQRIRAVQLDNLLHYLHRARERMDQTRRQFRQKQAERGYRRAAAALTEVKRARDQLRDPVEVLGAVITDLQELGRHTAATAAAEGGLGDATLSGDLPTWLTFEYLQETQVGVLERTSELKGRLEAGLAAQDPEPAQEQGQPSNDPQDPGAEKVLALVREALPHIERGEETLGRARDQLQQRAAREAVREQADALRALLDARECFLDVRGLIEALYGDERILQQTLMARLSKDEGEPEIAIAEYLPQLSALQEKNLARADRLSQRLDEALAEAMASSGGGESEAAADPNAKGPGADAPSPAEMEQQRTDLAKQYLASANAAMTVVLENLTAVATLETVTGAEAEDRLRTTDELTLRAVESIENLRRLYFSIIEHLQDAARRQNELNDETEEVRTLVEAAEQPQRLGPLAPRQRDLENLAEGIADALTKQSQMGPAQGAASTGPGAGQPGQDEAAAQQAKQLARAGELVTAAGGEMAAVANQLDDIVTAAAPTADALVAARKHQDDALRLLLEALALLQPPNEDPQEQEQQQQDQQQDQQGQQEQEQQAREDQNADPTQQLQGVRDREAQRRREKEERKSRGYDAVEKDW